MSVVSKIAKYAVDLRFEDLPADVVHSAKRLLADAMCCAAAGWDRATTVATRQVFPGVSGPIQASVWGDGTQAWAPAAAFVNGTMVREPEINDTFTDKTPGHASETIPAVVALCEARGRSGKELLTATVAAYEIYSRLCRSAKLVGGDRGWHHTTFGIVVVPAVGARCLGFDQAMAENAIAISSSYGITLNQLHLGHTSGLRSVVFPMAAYTGITSCLLAEAGLVGPLDVLEGPHGFYPQLFGDDYDLGVFDDWSEPLIQQSSIKLFSCSYYIHTALEAFKEVIDKNRLRAADIERVVVGLTRRPFEVVAQKSRVEPDSIEAADHSLTFSMALLATRGTVYPRDFTAETLEDEQVLSFAKKIEIEVNEELDREYPLHRARPAIVSVYTRDGLAGTARSIYPLGDFRAPLSDDQLFGKFNDLTETMHGRDHARRLWDAIFALDRCDDVRTFVERLVPSRG